MSESIPPASPAQRPVAPELPELPPLRAGWPEFLPGWVWLMGAGPGDAGLVTLHGLNALRQADTIVIDALVAREILDWARPEAEIIEAGKRGWVKSPVQRDISMRLIEEARAGKRVLRLKGGDPFVFGRGGEEAQTLVQHGVGFRILPGISAGIGGLAYAGIPVTHRDVGNAVTFVTANHPENVNWADISRGSPDIVIYMGMRALPHIRTALLAAGRGPDEPLAVVANATTPRQEVLETTLGACVEAVERSGLGAPAIICVGRAVLLRQALDWQALARGEAVRNLDPLANDPASKSGA